MKENRQETHSYNLTSTKKHFKFNFVEQEDSKNQASEFEDVLDDEFLYGNPHGTELEFSPTGIFFKANSLIYKQNLKMTEDQMRKTMQKKRYRNNSDVIVFDHFLVLKGCKLLISFTIRPIILNLFFEPFKNMADIINRVPKRPHKENAENVQENVKLLTNIPLITEKNKNIKKNYLLGIKVENPQFNLNDYHNKT